MIPGQDAPATLGLDCAAETALQVLLCDSWAELEAHGGKWERLLAGSPSASIFVTPEWLGSWWTAFASERRLLALLFLDSAGELVGLAPLYQDVIDGPLGLRLNRLRLVGDGSNDSDNLDFVLRPGYERSCIAAFFSWLERQSDWGVCELNTLPSDSAAAPWILRGLKERGWVHEIHTHPRLVVLLPSRWEAYLARLSRNERWRIVSYSRRLEAKYRVRVRRSENEQDLAHDLDTLFRLHEKRWECRDQRGSFTLQARRKFYCDVARRFLARRWLEFWLLELEGKPLAAQFGFRYRETLYTLQEGFDPNYSKDRIGSVLRAHVLQQVIPEGIRRYDFLAGNDAGKERWGPESWHYLDIHFAKPLSRGGLYLDLRCTGQSTKEWLRAHLPPSLFATARRTYHLLKDHTPLL
jgi:CelD/BcsL family acetyltransferase involved in cellulose biosynthesis